MYLNCEIHCRCYRSAVVRGGEEEVMYQIYWSFFSKPVVYNCLLSRNNRKYDGMLSICMLWDELVFLIETCEVCEFKYKGASPTIVYEKFINILKYVYTFYNKLIFWY